jgi:glutamine synthetase
MVRVPGPGRFELRLPDGAANPYLMQAVILAAGLAGLRDKLHPGTRSDINMYEDGHTIKDAPRLPLNLLDALRLLEASVEFKETLGTELVDAFIKLKMKEWNAYASHFTQWERDNTLDV